jgi:hypothetical protein
MIGGNYCGQAYPGQGFAGTLGHIYSVSGSTAVTASVIEITPQFVLGEWVSWTLQSRQFVWTLGRRQFAWSLARRTFTFILDQIVTLANWRKVK